MSIIVKPNIYGRSNSSGKGYPPANCMVINHTVNDKQVWVKWEDPDNTILNDSIISQWKGTLLVRNDNHYPESVKDGIVVCDNTIKNQYKDTWFKDTGLTNGTTYYYRFFTYSTENAYNTVSNEYTIFKEIPNQFSPILSENTWEQIDAASSAGIAPNLWNIGDEINIQFSDNIANVNGMFTLQIWDFNHFDKSDGSGKAGIVFGCKYLISSATIFSNQNGGWEYSLIRRKTLISLYNAMDQNLQSVIKEVTVKFRSLVDYTFYDYFKEVNDKLFLPSITELGLECPNYPSCNEGPTFPIFSDDASRIKKYSNSAVTDGYPWWTRSLLYGSKGIIHPNDSFYIVTKNGGIISQRYDSSSNVCFCFNI